MTVATLERRNQGSYGNREIPSLMSADMGSKTLRQIKEERNASLKTNIEKFFDSTSTSETEQIHDLLSSLAPTEEGRKRVLNRLFPAGELAKIMRMLEAQTTDAASNIVSYRRYMKDVHRRLDNFASIWGGRQDTWGFVNGADHEDIRDARNEDREISEREYILAARRKVLLAMHRTAEYGDPWPQRSQDKFEDRIRSLAVQE